MDLIAKAKQHIVTRGSAATEDEARLAVALITGDISLAQATFALDLPKGNGAVWKILKGAVKAYSMGMLKA